MSKNSLYQISHTLLELFSRIEDQDGEITDEQLKLLEIREGELSEKAESYLEVIGQQEAFISRIDDEMKRLKELKKQKTNIIDRLKNNLLNAVNLFGEFEVGTHTFGKRKSTSVTVDESVVNSLPSEYKTVKVTESADKKAIKDALNKGVEIEGCSLTTNYSLKIK